jgi:Uma2 family endonuclease
MRTAKVDMGPTLTTGEELSRRGDIGRCELVRGQIVLASPTSDEHGGIEGNFYHELRSFVLPRKLGKVRVGEAGVYTQRSPDTVRGADVLFISNERYSRRGKKRGFLDVAPELVVEVLSASESQASLEEKLGEYFATGVRLVWVADPEQKTIRAYRSLADVRTLGQNDLLSGDDVLPGFCVPVSRLFED